MLQTDNVVELVSQGLPQQRLVKLSHLRLGCVEALLPAVESLIVMPERLGHNKRLRAADALCLVDAVYACRVESLVQVSTPLFVDGEPADFTARVDEKAVEMVQIAVWVAVAVYPRSYKARVFLGLGADAPVEIRLQHDLVELPIAGFV
jgi:hypothetical protein